MFFFAQLLYFSPRTIKIPGSVSELQQKSSIFIKEHLTFHESFFIGDDHWVCVTELLEDDPQETNDHPKNCRRQICEILMGVQSGPHMAPPVINGVK